MKKKAWRELVSKGKANFKPIDDEEDKEEKFLLLDGVLGEYSMEMLSSYVSKHVTNPVFTRETIN